MSAIVLGVATSHSPLLAIPHEMWVDRGRDDRKRTAIHLADGRVVTYAQLADETNDRFAAFAQPDVFAAQAAAAQAALDRLADAIAEAAPDVVVVIGDDQEELFGLSFTPAVAVYAGDEIVTYPKNELAPNLPDWYRTANVGYLMDRLHRHPAAPSLARSLVESMIAHGIDPGWATAVDDPNERGFGHAYGFVIDRLLRRAPIPMLPIMLNTYFPPNVPRPGRCWDIGVALAHAIDAFPGDVRVCVVASGGLSHFATDADLDRRVLDALMTGDEASLRAIPPDALRSGNSEILNWIAAGGALRDLVPNPPDYIPVYRTPAGTGIGLGFMVWTPDASAAPVRTSST